MLLTSIMLKKSACSSHQFSEGCSTWSTMMMSTGAFCGINLAHFLLIIACIGGFLQLRPGLKPVLESGLLLSELATASQAD